MKIKWSNRGISTKSIIQDVVIPIPTDYIAYYKFDGDATDETGDYDGTIQGTLTYTSDRFGNSNRAIVFNNTKANYIKVNYDIPFTDEWTVSVWIKEPINTTRYFLSTKHDSGVGGNNIGIRLAWYWDDTDTFRFQNNISTYYSPTQTRTTNWYNLIISSSSNDNEICLYYDGVKSTTTGHIDNLSNQWLTIGSNDGINYEFDGYMDALRIYDRVLTSDEVSALYNETNPV